VALINLFKPDAQPEIEAQNTVDLDFEIAAEPTIEIQNHAELEAEIAANPIAETAKVQPTIEVTLSQEKIAEKSAEIHRKSFAEKKEKFIHCINLLTQFIAQKLTSLQSSIQPYEESLQRVGDLKRQLDTQNYIAVSAKKFSHNVTSIDYKVSCVCGGTPGPCGLGLKCNFCKSPVFRKEIRKTNPVYVADTAARQEAQTQSQTIALMLEEEVNKYPRPPAEYEIKNQLIELNNQLRGLLPTVQTERDASNLSSLLSQYKKVLSKAENQFSSEDHFHKSDFTPKSDYAQYYITAKMLQQLTRQNGLFKSTPEELQKQIARFTTSTIFSEEDARHIFNHS
jgi:hypothetical protein